MKENIELINRRLDKNKDFRIYIDSIIKDSTLFLQSNFRHLEVHDYRYDVDEAVKELGLDSELIHQLVEDYVIQILKSSVQFVEHIDKLKIDRDNDAQLNYDSIRELAHKNLGVARNLRIEDAIIFLHEMMTKDDLEYLSKCAHALESCAIKLKPICAYETMKLMKLKDSL